MFKVPNVLFVARFLVAPRLQLHYSIATRHTQLNAIRARPDTLFIPRHSSIRK
jgi:hypothetical protein